MKTASRFLIILSLAAVFVSARTVFGVVSPRGTSEDPAQRSLPGDLALILCERDAIAADFQKHGIVDAQISVKRLTPKNPQDHLKPAALRERAIKHAAMTDNSSFAFGRCADGSAWMVSMPARDQIVVEAETMRIPVGIATSCVKDTLEIRFAAEKRGRSFAVPRTLATNGDLIATLPGMKGFIGVSCIFSRRTQSGPRELALMPVGGVVLGALTKDMENVRSEGDMLRWINRRRAEESLPPLAISEDLTLAAKSLIGRASISHDLVAMAKISDGLRVRGIDPIGEDRAMGSSFADIALMFWQSPAHRDLFLHPRGHLYGAASQTTENGIFVSVVVGDRGQAPVARLSK